MKLQAMNGHIKMFFRCLSCVVSLVHEMRLLEIDMNRENGYRDEQSVNSP